MSGRYRLTRSQKQLEENFDTTGEVEMFPGYNIAPHSRS
jgi:putative SOS response-associated peptidase YedK